MQLIFNSILLAATARQISAHYRWTSLIYNGIDTGPYVSVRQNTNDNNPITDVTTTNLTCNSGGRSAGSTTTANVAAGSIIGFALDEAIFHHGVINVYMAKAPSSVATFDGAGNVWFKIYDLPPVTNDITQVTFEVPPSLPNGEYLVRIEHIALHLALEYPGAEFYIACAQVNVANGGHGTPKPLIALPGYYSGQEPGIKVNIYYLHPVQPKNYTQPGPAVWKG
ncbi:hypothetical protein BDV93DRAFT_579349 [Ceratobasidium sp. AG-I]|nr:hypothetical protein BDV93DRAFT_579349 [Ceratobasidium sp. AG-I]